LALISRKYARIPAVVKKETSVNKLGLSKDTHLNQCSRTVNKGLTTPGNKLP